MSEQNKSKCDKIECDVFDKLSHSVLVIDKDFNILLSNKAACKMMNCSDIKGQKCYAVTHDEEKPCQKQGYQCPVQLSIESKESSQVVHKHIYDGVEVFEEITATPVFDDDGNLLYVIEELRDISKLLKLETVINHLRNEIETLHGIIPICSSCKKVRDDEGYWAQVEDYLSSRSDAKFSHSICPDCLKELYPEVAKKMEEKGKG